MLMAAPSDTEQDPTVDKLPLLSEKPWQISREPFVYGYVDDFLPAELFKTLRDDFPVLDSLNATEELTSGKRRQRVNMNTAIPSVLSDQWQTLIKTLRSPAYLADSGRWAKPLVTMDRNLRFHPWWLRHLGDRSSLREWDVDLDCQFSTFGENDALGAHTDSTEKILAFILYFAADDWQSEWGGGTQIYRPLDKQYNTNWSNSFLQRSETEQVFDCEFRPNRLFFFVKSPNSWHGVSPIACPPGVIRRSFNFHVSIPKRNRKHRSHRLKEKLIKAYEKPRFNRRKNVEVEGY